MRHPFGVCVTSPAYILYAGDSVSIHDQPPAPRSRGGWSLGRALRGGRAGRGRRPLRPFGAPSPRTRPPAGGGGLVVRICEFEFINSNSQTRICVRVCELPPLSITGVNLTIRIYPTLERNCILAWCGGGPVAALFQRVVYAGPLLPAPRSLVAGLPVARKLASPAPPSLGWRLRSPAPPARGGCARALAPLARPPALAPLARGMLASIKRGLK